MLKKNTDLLPLAFCRRTVGRPAIERSTRALLIRVHRFGRHRATSPANVQFAARWIDGLTALLQDERPSQFHDGENEE
jgi:hypothetical protein